MHETIARWVKVAATVPAIIGVVGVNVRFPNYEGSAWPWVWLGGLVVWGFASLVIEEPGVRLRARFPFLVRRPYPEGDTATGRGMRFARRWLPVAAAVHWLGFLVWLIRRAIEAATPLP